VERRTKLTDEQKKKIIADFVITNNYLKTARMNNVSDTTVRRIVNSDKETLKKVEEKKEENTHDILDYIDTQFEKQKNVIKLSLEALEKKLKNPDAFTNVKDIATVYGILIDKAQKTKELKMKEKELILKNKEIEKTSRVVIINDLDNRNED
jgi:hypothetical protein